MDSAVFKGTRAAMGLSTASLADRLGISKRMVDLWEAGRCPVPEDITKRLLEFWDHWVGELDRLMNPTYADAETLIYYRTEKSYTDAHPHASFDYHEYNALVTAAFAACAAEGLPRKIIWA
ncbi:helix-turn-helix domain-containing protein [Actinotignum sp. GS-2025e]|uniref:helix-turn-helix domain-containing protein n=1 Tax=Actinotignum TaxID=1653174 RepID=UPI00254A32FA|nr:MULTISPECIES: helix-turn-helix transcriptional regulator [Actinotignum]MDK7272065.1 helix-turn-helix transcriptional regulator [Actinotignum schaalii]MDK8657853.1 helix-turn-helix transcriptional regulator [Actinotignum sanguinis]